MVLMCGEADSSNYKSLKRRKAKNKAVDYRLDTVGEIVWNNVLTKRNQNVCWTM